ncbi:MAG: hypothetical protein SVZ03_06940 [Spirochaetota bacterium]|nr:hypothetical protein [Spirochaetota bacterium]
MNMMSRFYAEIFRRVYEFIFFIMLLIIFTSGSCKSVSTEDSSQRSIPDIINEFVAGHKDYRIAIPKV